MNATATTKTKPLALVTGASSGIGQAYARRLAADGYDLIIVGRRPERLAELAEEFAAVDVRPVAADLGVEAGLKTVAELCASEAITLLVNNAGVSHYMAFAELPYAKAHELLSVKVIAPTVLTRASVPGMIARGGGAVVNVAGMLAFGAAAPLGQAPGRATYVATLAHLVALSQALHEELGNKGIKIQVLYPGIVATEFHSRQGMDLSKLPRMSPEDVVTASLSGLNLGEVICAPGVEQADLLDTVVKANLAAFGGQSPALASRYQG